MTYIKIPRWQPKWKEKSRNLVISDQAAGNDAETPAIWSYNTVVETKKKARPSGPGFAGGV